MKTTVRRINYHAWVNDTFLAPYNNYLAKLIEYGDGRMDIQVDGCLINNVEGKYRAKNGWNYTVKKLLGRPLKVRIN